MQDKNHANHWNINNRDADTEFSFLVWVKAVFPIYGSWSIFCGEDSENVFLYFLEIIYCVDIVYINI